jgi:hypothetical protein
VAGTSNSFIQGGYADGLREAGLPIVGSFAIGASHSCVLPVLLKELEGMEADFIVLDLAPNQQRLMNLDMFVPEQAHQQFIDITAWAAAQNVIPVMLLMPTAGLSVNPTTDPQKSIRQFMLDACVEHGIICLDGYKFVTDYAEETGEPIRELFNDEPHLAPRIAQQLGQWAAEHLTHMFDSGELSTVRTSRVVDAVRTSLVVELPDAVEATVVDRSTARIGRCFVQLRHSESVELVLPPGTEVRGVLFNLAHTNASLRVAGANTTTKVLTTSAYGGGKTLWLSAFDLVETVVVGEDGRLVLECVMPSATDEVNDRMRGADLPGFDESESVVEVSALIVTLPPMSRRLLKAALAPAVRDFKDERLEVAAAG